MGTTDTALATGSGRFGWVLAIEGFEYLLTNAANVDAVLTAWAASPWTQALPGLKIIGGIKQSISPLKPDLDIPEITAQVLDCDGSDVFGKAVWRRKPSISSRLAEPFQPAADGSGTVRVLDNSGFAASGTFNLGVRTVAYSAKVGSDELTVPAAGSNAFPALDADTGNTYSWPSGTAAGSNYDIAAPPRAADVQQSWIGKKVALYMHRIVGGVWDTRAQAHLEFAGTIAGIVDGEPGLVSLTLRDLRADIESATLLRNQWVGYVKPGIYLRAGDQFRAREFFNGTGAVTTANSFTVVASGAASDWEVDEGTYEYDDFIARLAKWLRTDANLTLRWSVTRGETEGGFRTIVRATATTDAARALHFQASRYALLEFMGFYEVGRDDGWWEVESSMKWGRAYTITSPNAPYRIKALQSLTTAQQGGLPIELESSDGQWFEHVVYGPNFMQEISDSESNQSYIRVGEKQLAIANYSSATLLTSATPLAGFGQIYEDIGEYKPPGLTFDDEAEKLEVRQLVIMTDKLSVLLPRLLASIDGRGVNHADYDAFPWGAGVPWSVLGDEFVQSCIALEQSSETDTITVLLDRPTQLKDVLIPELALRFAFLVFKDGKYQFTTPQTPNATLADWDLDETNKAVAAGQEVPPSRSEMSSEMLVNILKMQHTKDQTGKFTGQPVTIIQQASIDVHGQSETVTVDAVNSFDSTISGISGSDIPALAAMVATRLFPMFDHPVKIITRTLAPTHYGMAPGDIASLTDSLVRDPTTGARSVTGRACMVLSVFHDYGDEDSPMAGECKLLMSDEDRTYPMSPAASIDTSYTSGAFTDGYDSGSYRLRISDHEYSRLTDAVDLTHFEVGDLVRIIEVDPADPASADTWDREIAAVSEAGSYIELAAAISAPAWGGATKLYAIIPQAYSAVQASQKDKAFQADAGDGLIENVIEANAWGSQNVAGAIAAATATDLPALIAEASYGDGEPVTPYLLHAATRMANNLIQYKSAPHKPLVLDGVVDTVETEYEVVLIMPFFIGGRPLAGRVRYISIAPRFETNTLDPSTAYVKVVSSRFPPTGLTTSAYKFSGLTREVEFSTTSGTTVIATAQNLMPVPAQMPGHTWLTVLLKRSVAGDIGTALLRGFATLYLKPLQP